MKNKKICLINPPTSNKMEPAGLPAGLLAIGSILKKSYKNVWISDIDVKSRKEKRKPHQTFYTNLIEDIVKTEPNIIGFTSYCNNLPVVIHMAMEIKKLNKDITIILGGPQPTFTASEIMKNFNCFDVISRGESESHINKLIFKINNNDSLEFIPNITYKKSNKVINTEPGMLIEDLDCLPETDYSLLELTEYNPNKENINISIEAGRGCPFSCTFCSTSLMWQRKCRMKSIPRLYSDMTKAAKTFDYKHLALIHDNFTVNKSYLIDFCNYLIMKNTPFTWACSSRADQLDEETLNIMKEAGCCEIYFGIESGSARIQKQTKKNLNISKVKNVLKKVATSDINCISSFIIGHIEETKIDLDQTLELILYLKLNGINLIQMHLLAAHSGTKVYEEVKDHLFLKAHSSHLGPIESLEWSSKLYDIVKAFPEIFPAFYHFHRKNIDSKFLEFIQNSGFILINSFFRSIYTISCLISISPVELLYRLYKNQFKITNENISSNDIEKAFHCILEIIRSEKKDYINDILEYELAIYKLSVLENSAIILKKHTKIIIDGKTFKLKSKLLLRKLRYEIENDKLANMIKRDAYYLFVSDEFKFNEYESSVVVFEIEEELYHFLEIISSKDYYSFDTIDLALLRLSISKMNLDDLVKNNILNLT
ncbi:MAG: radical SAM protein [Pseudomonadota bacterium]